MIQLEAVTDANWREGLNVFHLLIDRHRQRQGLGRATVRRLVELGRSDQRCRALRLTVNPDNASAIALYESAGFREMGTDNDGELQMTLPL